MHGAAKSDWADRGNYTASERNGSAQPELSEAEAWRRFEQLDAEVQQVRQQPLADPLLAAQRLTELERQLHALGSSLSLLEGNPKLQPLDLASTALRDWKRFAASLQLDNNRAHCDLLLTRLLDDQAKAWEQATALLPACPEPDLCFRAWLETSTRQLEAISHGPAVGETAQRLGQIRLALQQSLLRCLEDFTPDKTLRLRWTNELIDRSEMVLTSAEDLPPDLAARQMLLAADDVDFHLKHVESAGGQRRRRLKRKRWRLRAEAQERLLQARLEGRFGPRNVERFDRLILALICLVFGLLLLEFVWDLSPAAQFWLNLTDAAICGVFIWEFAVRLALASDRGLWFMRHVLIDLIPSIPFGLLAGGLHGHSAADAVQLGRATRFLRLRPIVRLLRAIGFLARGMDRLARRLAPVLNRSVILYPTRAERQRAQVDSRRLGQRFRRLYSQVGRHWKRLVLATDAEGRGELAATRLTAFRELRTESPIRWDTSQAQEFPALREVPAEVVLRRLASLKAHQVTADLGEEVVGRLARMVRMFARPPLAWLPLIRSTAPQIGPWMGDGDVVAAAGRRLATTLKQYHDRWFWLADLHGTVTPSVFVDRVGTMLVKSSFRPAYRLALFGGVYMLVLLMLKVTPVWFLHDFEQFMRRFVGSALLMLGGVCCVVFGFGWWLKRLAREATEFYERAAEAQFLSLTEMIRSRHLDRDAEILYHRVLRPEWGLREDGAALTSAEQIGCFTERVRLSLLGSQRATADGRAFDLLDRTALLYRDSLDGAMFVDSDNRTTCQLLGNPAVRQFLALSQRIDRKQARGLLILDLERQKSLFGGPYLWFNFISRAAAHSVACLIVDYNRHAIPLGELTLAPEANRRRYEAWLTSSAATNTATGEISAATDESSYVTTAFTALHFLDFDAERDREVEQRFGPELRDRLRRDRGQLIRRIFGTYPWNLQPKERRVLNVYALYERWAAGGRALLLPVFVLIGGVRIVLRVAGGVWQAVNEIRRPELRVDRSGEMEADFAAAARKIERMRGPVVCASLKLRTTLDPEYLGIPLPGCAATALEGADVQSDLEFLDAEPWVVEQVDLERRRAEADMRRFGKLLDEGLLERAAALLGLPTEAIATPAHRRAAAVAYLADLRGVRRLLSSEQIIEEVFERAPHERPHYRSSGLKFTLRGIFKRYWEQTRSAEDPARDACWWAVVQNLWGVADALRVWRRQGDQARAEGERVLAEILRHPGRITEQLVTLRTIQTLALLDVLNYRRHIYELGQYRDHGDAQEDLLRWSTLGKAPPPVDLPCTELEAAPEVAGSPLRISSCEP